MNKKVKQATEAPIYTHQDVHAFIWNCINELKINFHPDTPFSDYVNEENKSPFTQKERAALDKTLEECIVLCDKEGYDMYEMVLDIINMDFKIRDEVLHTMNIEIRGTSDISMFLSKCKNNLGITFDVDFDFAGCIGKNGKPYFSEVEANVLSNMLNLCHWVCFANDWNIYELATS